MLDRIPHGLDEIIETFGSLDTPNFSHDAITSFLFPYPLRYEDRMVTHGACHHLAVDHFVHAFTEIQRAGMWREVLQFSGIYARRSIRGHASHPSTHSWGISIDLEAVKYPLGSSNRFPEVIVEIFKTAGFFYGGNFKSRRDPMHFQLCTGY